MSQVLYQLSYRTCSELGSEIGCNITIYYRDMQMLKGKTYFSALSSPANSIKYALMKSSIFPSITPFTSEVW